VHGLFIGLANEAIVAGESGIPRLEKKKHTKEIAESAHGEPVESMNVARPSTGLRIGVIYRFQV
jgi:hypothetical protein